MHNLSVLKPNILPQEIFRLSRSFTPHSTGIPQLGLAFVDEQVSGFPGDALDNNAVVARCFEIDRPEAACCASTQRILCQRAEVYGGHLGSPRREPCSSDGASHQHHFAFRTERFGIKRQFPQQDVGCQRLPAKQSSQQRLLRQILIFRGACGEIDAQDPAHVTTGQARHTLLRKKLRSIRHTISLL